MKSYEPAQYCWNFSKFGYKSRKMKIFTLNKQKSCSSFKIVNKFWQYLKISFATTISKSELFYHCYILFLIVFALVSNATCCFNFFPFLFISDTQPSDITSCRKQKRSAQDQLHEELNSINSKIASYTKLKSTLDLSKELSLSLVSLRKGKR